MVNNKIVKTVKNYFRLTSGKSKLIRASFQTDLFH